MTKHTPHPHTHIEKEWLLIHLTMQYGIVPSVAPIHFCHGRMASIWQIINDRHTAGLCITRHDIFEAAQLSVNELEEISKIQRVEFAVEPDPEDVFSLAEIVIENSIDRTARFAVSEILNKHGGNQLVLELTQQMEHLLDVPSDSKHIAEITNAIIEEMKHPESRKSGIATGIESLDNMLTFDGLPLGHITVFAGATSSGKSALANTCMLSAIKNNKSILCCAFEDSPNAVVRRCIANLCLISNRDVQRNNLSEIEIYRAEGALKELSETRLWFIDKIPNTITELTTKIKQIVHRNKIELIIIDFLQLIKAGKNFGKRQDTVDYIFGEIVQTANQLENTATLVVSQLRRVKDKCPTKEDLYHSGAIEQWSHTVGLLWKPETGTKGYIAFILDKQKNGPTGILPLGWEPEYMQYRDAAGENMALEFIREIEKARKD